MFNPHEAARLAEEATKAAAGEATRVAAEEEAKWATREATLIASL